MRSPFSVLLIVLCLAACAKSSQDLQASLVAGTPFVPSNAQSGWTADLVTSVIQCQATANIVADFCSCTIKAVTVGFSPDQVSQAAKDAQSSGTTADVQSLGNIAQSCLSQLSPPAGQFALAITSVNRSYVGTEANCSTGVHTFVTDSLFCILLQRDSRNNSCALSQRQSAFAQACQGTFQETP